MAVIEDWNGQLVEVEWSHGGVVAACDYTRNMLTHVMNHDGDEVPWPPAEIVQKLYQSSRGAAFQAEVLTVLAAKLGYYCDLQSIHSEDAIVWSYFGPLLYRHGAERAAFLRWLMKRCLLEVTDRRCEISLWRRVPHPQALVSGGPEIDVTLSGDRTVVLIEAKWGAPIGVAQGIGGNLNQLELRSQYLHEYGQRIYGEGKRFLVLCLLRDLHDVLDFIPPAGVEFRRITWQQIGGYPEHPRQAEFARYLAWKSAPHPAV